LALTTAVDSSHAIGMPDNSDATEDVSVAAVVMEARKLGKWAVGRLKELAAGEGGRNSLAMRLATRDILEVGRIVGVNAEELERAAESATKAAKLGLVYSLDDAARIMRERRAAASGDKS
jgi:predicted nucleic acid-binding protein